MPLKSLGYVPVTSLGQRYSGLESECERAKALIDERDELALLTLVGMRFDNLGTLSDQ